MPVPDSDPCVECCQPASVNDFVPYKCLPGVDKVRKVASRPTIHAIKRGLEGRCRTVGVRIMAKARAAQRRDDEPASGRRAARSGAWREQLEDHAAALWKHSAAGGPSPLPPRLSVLGAMADEALAMVETFTLGALARAKRDGGKAPAALPEDFRLQLGLILNGLEPSVQDSPEAGEAGPPLIGKSTRHAMQSGVMNGVLAEMEGIIERYRHKSPALRVVLCGGDSAFFESSLKPPIFAVPELVLIGLNRILTYNVALQ